ncbi:hypothetical protein YC2023_046166 [Brassica napus]
MGVKRDEHLLGGLKLRKVIESCNFRTSFKIIGWFKLNTKNVYEILLSMQDSVEETATNWSCIHVHDVREDLAMSRLHFACICLYQVFEYHMEFLETFGCIWSSKGGD